MRLSTGLPSDSLNNHLACWSKGHQEWLRALSHARLVQLLWHLTVHDSFGELSTEPRCAFERVVGGPTRTRFERILLASNRSAPGRVTSQAILSIGVEATPSSAPSTYATTPNGSVVRLMARAGTAVAGVRDLMSSHLHLPGMGDSQRSSVSLRGKPSSSSASRSSYWLVGTPETAGDTTSGSPVEATTGVSGMAAKGFPRLASYLSRLSHTDLRRHPSCPPDRRQRRRPRRLPQRLLLRRPQPR